MNRRDEDVRRPIAVELQNQLGKVGLDRAQTGWDLLVETATPSGAMMSTAAEWDAATA